MSKRKPKTLEIRTIEELCDAATPENGVRLVNDIAMFIAHVIAVKAVQPDAKINGFYWTDDGDHVITGVRIARPKEKAQ